MFQTTNQTLSRFPRSSSPAPKGIGPTTNLVPGSDAARDGLGLKMGDANLEAKKRPYLSLWNVKTCHLYIYKYITYCVYIYIFIYLLCINYVYIYIYMYKHLDWHLFVMVW